MAVYMYSWNIVLYCIFRAVITDGILQFQCTFCMADFVWQILYDECVIFFRCYFMIILWTFVNSTFSPRNGVHLHAINVSLPVIPTYLRSFILHKHAYPHLLSLPHLLLISSPSISVTCFNRTLESSCLHDVADYKQYTTVNECPIILHNRHPYCIQSQQAIKWQYVSHNCLPQQIVTLNASWMLLYLEPATFMSGVYCLIYFIYSALDCFPSQEQQEYISI